jgi:hypothetical protein
MLGAGAFKAVETSKGVRAIRAPLTYPASMMDERPWRDGMYMPSDEIRRRVEERTVKVKELLNRDCKPLTDKHISAAELITTFTIDARLPRSKITLLLKLFDDLKITGVIAAVPAAAGQLALVPKTSETLHSRALLGDKISRSSVKATVQHYCTAGIGQLQTKASLVAIDNGLIALQEMFSDSRLKFELGRPTWANGRPGSGDTGPEFIHSQQCYDARQSVPSQFDYCFMELLR